MGRHHRGGPARSACSRGSSSAARAFESFSRKGSTNRSASSRAIGVSPPSLEILADLGLDRALVASGVPIRDVTVFGKKRVLGKVSFASVPSAYPYMLSVPQRKVEALLAEELAKHPSAVLLRGRDVVGVHGEGAGVRVVLAAADGGRTRGEGPLLPRLLRREEFGQEPPRRRVRMGTGTATPSSWATSRTPRASGRRRASFSPPTARSSLFPLPDGLRRWIVQTRGLRGGAGALLHRRPRDEPHGHRARSSGAGLDESLRRPAFTSPPPTEEGAAFSSATPPIPCRPSAARGMNTGFADVDLLAPLLAARLRWRREKAGDEAFALWEKRRRRALHGSRRTGPGNPCVSARYGAASEASSATGPSGSC